MKSSPSLLLAAFLPLHAEPAVLTLRFDPDDVLSTRVAHDGERTITFQQVMPMALPVPKPAPRPAIAQRTAAASLPEAKPRRIVQLGASVYVPEGDPSATRTLLHYWTHRSEAPVVLLSDANFLWLSRSFGDFETETASFSLLMAISPARLSRLSDMATVFAEQFPGKPLPVFNDPDTASFVVVEGSPTAEQLEPIQALFEHYNTNRPALEARYLANQQLARQRREEEALNPPAKKDLVVRYWRSDPQGRKQATPTSNSASR